MLQKDQAHEAVRRLFRRQTVATLREIFLALGTRSRMSVFRRLREIGYLTSFTHAGRYYTLTEVPRFDEKGLWFVEEVGFSRLGSLKDTVPALVSEAPAGMTHGELFVLLRVRVFNTLHELLDEGRIAWERRGRTRLYLSPDEGRAAAQLALREEMASVRTGKAPPLPAPVVLEVLVEAVRVSGVAIDAAGLAARLSARGVEVTPAAVRQVCERHGIRLEKKTAE